MDNAPTIQQYVGENIKKFRLARGMTLDDLAARIYKSKSTISKYEKGSIARPHIIKFLQAYWKLPETNDNELGEGKTI
jgi:ribosome-binding protein aMBF1 (putative translation factor)